MNNNMLIPAKIPPISSFEAYKSYVNNIPNLSEEEEIFLVKKFKNENCLVSVQKLIISQLKTVLYVASKYVGYGLPQEDLVQEGSIGLMRAVKNFDLKYKVRLYTYAIIWIKSEIQSYILKNWKIVKIATTKNFKKLFFNFRGTQKELIDLGVSKNELIKHVSTKLGVSEEEVKEMHSYLSFDDISLEYESDDKNSIEIPYHKTPELEYQEKHDNDFFEKKLNANFLKLTSNQQKVLELRYFQEDKKTYKEIANILNISSERVRQIEQEALTKLRKIMILEK